MKTIPQSRGLQSLHKRDFGGSKGVRLSWSLVLTWDNFCALGLGDATAQNVRFKQVLRHESV